MLGELGVDQAAELRVHGRQHLGQLLDLGDGHPRVVRASAISRPMYPAPTMIALAGAVSSRVRMSANVSPMECSRCTPSPGPSAPGPRRPLDRGLDRDGASANKQLVVGDQLLGPRRR